MIEFDTEKGELITVELWQDEDRDERYQDGGRDMIWIDRINVEQFDCVDDFIISKLSDISDTVYVDVRACRSSTVVQYEPGDEFYGVFINNISIEEIGDDCLGGGEYIWTDGKLVNRYSMV